MGRGPPDEPNLSCPTGRQSGPARIAPQVIGFVLLIASQVQAKPEQGTSSEPAVSASVAGQIRPLRSAIGFAALDRPTGIAEFGFGWLTLPGASICVVPLSSCSEGDTSFEIDAWQLFRGSTRFAFGAGILFGLIPTTEAQSGEFDRDHSRQYLTMEGTLRYYPYVGHNVEWWVGITGGLVVVSDRFKVTSKAPDRALLGPQGVTLRTEGGSLGIAGGPVVALTDNWALGATLRYGQWFLPRKPEVDAAGSRASLTGRNTVLSLGVAVAFRLAL